MLNVINSIKSCPVIYYIARLQIYKVHVSSESIIKFIVLKMSSWIILQWNSVKYCIEIKQKSIEFNIKYIYERFYGIKFLNIRHCCYYEQTYSSLYTLFIFGSDLLSQAYVLTIEL